MKQTLITILLVIAVVHCYSQELYVYTEPASNMPSRSVGVKLTGRFFNDKGFNQRYIPELMFGINKNWMVHLSSGLSDYYSDKVRVEGAKVYVKYRFLSIDEVHKHFRMAAFADVAFTRNPYIYDEVSLEGDNDGAQTGLIATQLINKLAVSSTVSYTRVLADKQEHLSSSGLSLNNLNYSLSAGYLLLPKEYVDYKQTNINLYIEFLGMRSIDNALHASDLAPAVQLIFNSNTKINVGYRFRISGNMTRMAKQTWQISLERTILNVWK